MQTEKSAKNDYEEKWQLEELRLIAKIVTRKHSESSSSNRISKFFEFTLEA